MTKTRIAAAAVFLLLIALSAIMWQRRQNRLLEADNLSLRGVTEQLRQENQRLADTSQSSNALSEADQRDLMRLRGQATTFSQLERQSIQLKAERDDLAARLSNDSSSATKTVFPEPTNEQARRMARLNFAKYLALSCFMYADSHNDQLPADLAALVSDDLPFRLDNKSPSHSGADWASAVEILYQIREDQFEFVYRGALHQVKNPGELILFKEKQPTERSDKQLERLYIFCDGHVQFFAPSDGNFDAWEKEHTPSEALTPSSQ